MRTPAIILSLLTLFPILGPIAGFFLAMFTFGGISLYFGEGYDPLHLALAALSVTGLLGIFSATAATLHFINTPEARLGYWQCRAISTGLVLGCVSYIGFAFIDLGFFLLMLTMSPLLLFALCLLGMIALRQLDVL